MCAGNLSCRAFMLTPERRKSLSSSTTSALLSAETSRLWTSTRYRTDGQCTFTRSLRRAHGAVRCCGDEPFLFRERWEKLFEDFCDVKQEKFDPSRVSELYDTIKYCALHQRPFLFAIFDERQQEHTPGACEEHGTKCDREAHRDRRLHELYGRAKALFDLVAPQEYGIEPHEKYVACSISGNLRS
jgi:hypothetical protein